jgi:hypothetical protein
MTLRSTDYALLSQASYKDPEISSRGPGGVIYKEVHLDGVTYRPLDHFDDPKTGFQATAYQREDTKEVVIAYRGTEFDREAKQDGLADATMAVNGTNVQSAESMAFTQRVIDAAKQRQELKNEPFNVTVTGHSLGGTLAEINAYKFGLHGETFNAFGAAGLMHGVPQGGNQIIDHVRATDLVSAASAHFGQVRVYAVPQDTQALSHAGYSDNRLVDALAPHTPILGKIQIDAHAIDNFVPKSELLGHSIMTAQNEAYAKQHEHMIQPYRDDVMVARTVAFAGYQTQKPMLEGAVMMGEAAVHTGQYLGREAVHAYDVGKEKAVEGLHATERAAQYVGHETVKGYNATVDATSRGIEATMHAGHQAYDATVNATSHGIEATVDGAKAVGHFGERVYGATVDATSRGMEDVTNFAKAHPIHLDHPSHPDNKLFQQAHDGVKKLDAEHGRASDHHSANLAGALTVEAKSQGLKRIDMVALSDDGSKAFAAEKVIPGAFKNVAGVETAHAVNLPIEQSTQQMAHVNQALQQQTQAQSQQQAAPVNPQQANPTITR